MPINYKKYYNYLIQTFGCANYSGCLALARLIAMYDEEKQLQDLYKEYSEQFNLTPTAVERCVRVYLQAILKEYSIEDIANVLDYNFKPGQTRLVISEIIPVIKFRLEEEQ